MKKVSYPQSRCFHDRIVSLNLFMYKLEGRTNIMKMTIDGMNEMK